GEQAALDQEDAALEAALGARVGDEGVQEADAARDGRVLPGLQEAGPVAADAVEQGHLLQSLGEGEDAGGAEAAATLGEGLGGVAGAARRLARHRPAAVDVGLAL